MVNNSVHNYTSAYGVRLEQHLAPQTEISIPVVSIVVLLNFMLLHTQTPSLLTFSLESLTSEQGVSLSIILTKLLAITNFFCTKPTK